MGFVDSDNTTVWTVDDEGTFMKDNSLTYRYLDPGKGPIIAVYAHLEVD